MAGEREEIEGRNGGERHRRREGGKEIERKKQRERDTRGET